LADKNPVELITIKKNYPYPNPDGPGYIDNWITFCQVYAEIQIGSGREFFGAKAVNSQLSGLAKTVQYISGITSDMRVYHRSNIYDLIGKPIEKYNPRANELHLKEVA
jgi:head-tail adaptor